jgi:hypothetical protein
MKKKSHAQRRDDECLRAEWRGGRPLYSFAVVQAGRVVGN